MPLALGTRLARYEVLGALGAGGMGEVYRATDTTLKREVALKILPPQFAMDASRLARFEREAQALASLNHPNIAAIHGLEHVDGVRFLVLELVEGQTIAERLATGRMDVVEAIRVATEIAAAIEAAHEKGIVHRDLKPANVKITADGKVKVLDFGLAKALGEADAAADPANSPTLTVAETRAGIVLGTAAYMSPEQAAGKPVDRRTDVWSFGVLLYEMLSGKKAFDGKTVSHVIVHVMEQEPDWTVLPPLPAGVQDLLERCLQKDVANRPRDIGDLRLQLHSAITRPIVPRSVTTRPRPARRRQYMVGGAATAVALSAVIAGFLYLRPKPSPLEAMRFEIAQPADARSTSFLSISPDGRKLAFVATGADNRTLIWIRSLETLESRPLDATLGVSDLPFWSPDSRHLAFTAQGSLKRIDVSGGPAQTLTSGQFLFGTGGFWTSDNRIVFSPTTGAGQPGPLLQVSAAGGTVAPLTRLDTARKETGHISPSLLPDGRHFVYTSVSPEGGIYLGALDQHETQRGRILLPDRTSVRYAPSLDPAVGYLLFVRRTSSRLAEFDLVARGTLMAATFDTRTLELRGDPIPVAEDVSGVAFSVSATGVLVYRTGDAMTGVLGVLETNRGGSRGQLTWFDRQGRVLGTSGDEGFYSFGTRLSPDGTRVAVTRPDQSGNYDIWIQEFARGVRTRFTTDPAPDVGPVWSPDGSRVTFASYRSGPRSGAIYEKAANGAGKEEPLVEVSEPVALTEWSRDGRFLLFYNGGREAGDLLTYAAEGRKIVPLLNSPQYVERGGSFSPDGRWFAYSSNESGTYEVYVRAFDPSSVSANGAQIIVSNAGGQGAHWSRDGKEIFYQAPDGTMMSAQVATQPAFKVGSPQALFKVPVAPFWDVTADGKKFLIPVPQSANAPAPYKVVLNWTSTLKK